MLIGWAVARTLPGGAADVRVPVVGLRLDFMYTPLVAVGFVLASSAALLRRTLVLLSALGAVVLGLGLAQVAAGGKLLTPTAPTPGLDNLVIERAVGAVKVLQPTGTFVDPGRFASMAIVGVVIALAAYPLAGLGLRQRFLGLCAIGVAVAAIWSTGGRGALLFGVALVGIAIIATGRAGRRGGGFRRALVASVVCGVAVVLIAIALPSTFSSRATYYSATLDPRLQTNEWAFRWNLYQGETLQGIRRGGVIGRGTGSQALGLQYLFGGADRSVAGLYKTEAGWGAVGYEWGLVGVILWALWCAAWSRRVRGVLRLTRGTSYGPTAVIIVSWITLFLGIQFIGGKQAFQNYVSNAYFWLLSGIVFGLPQLLKTAAEDESDAEYALSASSAPP